MVVSVGLGFIYLGIIYCSSLLVRKSRRFKFLGYGYRAFFRWYISVSD